MFKIFKVKNEDVLFTLLFGSVIASTKYWCHVLTCTCLTVAESEQKKTRILFRLIKLIEPCIY